MNWESVSKFGVVLIMDMTGYGLKHAKTVTPFNTHKLVNIFHVRVFAITIIMQTTRN